jgi:predicted ATPase
MKIKNLEIENFKCFGQKQSLDFGRITLLTGANSSGKSSLMYAILACMQSNSFPFMLSLNGDYVNMGDFEETVFRNDVKREIGINLEFEMPDFDNFTISTTWEKNNLSMPSLKILKSSFANIEITIQKNKTGYNHNFETHFEKKIVKENSFTRLVTKIGSFKHGMKLFFNENVENLLQGNNINISKYYTNINELIREDYNSIELSQFINEIMISIANKLKENINFSGSFRLSPQRGYLEKTQIVPKLAVSGEGYLDQILAWETEKSEKFKALKAIMKSLALTHDIKSKRSKGGKFEVLVKTKSNSVFSSLTDVGFGISNFLPIIVADLQLSDNSTLFVAQPETHLHPSVQSKFGEYLSSRINRTNKNYVVETHSEYLLNNIRLAIVKGEVKSEDVKIYYIEPDGTDRKIHHISFAKNGQILNAPKSFFDTYMIDVMNIALNATAE